MVYESECSLCIPITGMELLSKLELAQIRDNGDYGKVRSSVYLSFLTKFSFFSLENHTQIM